MRFVGLWMRDTHVISGERLKAGSGQEKPLFPLILRGWPETGSRGV